MQFSKKVLCTMCKRFRSDGANVWCKAFPKGIPDKILTGEHDHTKPFKGDNGILFEPLEELEEK